MSDFKALWDALNQPGITKLQDMLNNLQAHGITDGIVNLSEAIEVPPLTEDLGTRYGCPGKKAVDVDAERAAFEVWLLSDRDNDPEILDRTATPGEYTYEDVHLAWAAWLERASRG